jgi:hypothetical protein
MVIREFDLSREESRLKAKGCRKYYLLVKPDNLGVLAFYHKLGWEEMPLTIMGKVIE